MRSISDLAAVKAIGDRATLQEVHDRLTEAGFTAPRVESMLKASHPFSAAQSDVEIFRRRASGDAGLALFVRALVLGEPVPREAFLRAGSPAHALLAAGLVRFAADQVVPQIRLIPYGDLLIASDRSLETNDPSADHVIGVNRPAVMLANLTPRRRVTAALDIGCGGGIQSLLASRHAKRVVASDLNPRALVFTRLNAGLNGLEGIETRLGDLYRPVEGMRFGLIVSNPPYLISPDRTYLYRDGGEAGDTVCQRVVAGFARHLEEGGFAVALLNWITSTASDPFDRLRRWVSGTGCDAWIFHGGTDDSLTYAADWNRPHGVAAFAASLDRWMAYYEAAGIEAIAAGAVVLRRRDGANWVKTERLRFGVGELGDHVERLFAAQDFLAGRSDPYLLWHERLKPAPGCVLEQAMAAIAEGWTEREARLRMSRGIAFTSRVDGQVAQLLERLDGRRALAEVVEESSAVSGLGGPATAAFRERAVAATMRLFELGLVERVAAAQTRTCPPLV